MRIAYVLTTLGIGGAEKQVISLAEHMAARGHVVTLLVLKHSTAEEWPVKLSVMRLNMEKTPKSLWRGLGFAVKFLAIFRPDIIHSHTYPANIFARMLRWRGVHPPIVNTIHNVYEGGRHRMLLYRLTDRFVDSVTAVSSAAQERFVRTHAMPPRKISVLTNGIEAKEFTPDRNRRDRLRQTMRVENAFVWLAAGRLVPAKDYPNLISAFAIARKSRSNAVLWIAGEGDKSLVERECSSIPDVQLLGLRHDMPNLLDAADGFVLSSAWEGMPLVLGEAMAMRKPVVATDVGGVRELVGEAGVVVPARDRESLAGGMVSVMAMNDKRRREIGVEARRRIEQFFSMDAKTEEWLNLYSKLTSQENS